MPDKYRGMARREFLAAIGRAAGGSAMLRAMAALGIGTSISACGSSSAASAPGTPSPPPRLASPRPGDWPENIGAGKTVVILGAGIAGMTTAIEMARLGYSCTLLEARASAGGRVLTLRAGDVVDEIGSSQTCQFDPGEGLYFNAGASRIAQHHEFLLAYCRDFGVQLETFTNDNRGAWLHSPGAFGGHPQVARHLMADTRGGIAELLSTVINQGALDEELSDTDQANILAMLRQYGDLDINNGYRGTPRGGFPGQEEAGSRQRGALLPARQLQELATEFFWELRLSFSQGFDQQPAMLQPVGGMDRIVRGFESRVRSDIIFGATVTEIRKVAGGARIVYSDRSGMPASVEADYCVVTIPAPVLAGIANDFSAAHRSEIEAFQYTAAVRVAFQAPRFWEREHNIYGGITWSDQDITQIWYPNHGFQGETGIIIGAYIFDGPAGSRFADMLPATRVETTRAQASNVHPQFEGQASRGISVAWQKMPFQLGGWGTSNPAALLAADDSIVFAGEHLSILQGWQEGAILSAYAAIDQIVTRDLAA